LCLRADVVSFDDEKRTVDLVFSTGASIERYDWWTGKRFLEKLSLKAEHVRLERLNAGAPLLDAHSAWSVTDQLGVVESDSARVTGKEARATVRFSKRAAVDDIWNDVRDGIIKNVSVGYRVHKFEEDAGKDNKLPVRTAVDWEPFEISMVPMPADAGAQVRSGESANTNKCVLVTRSGVSMAKRTSSPASEPVMSETLVERDPLDPGAPGGPGNGNGAGTRAADNPDDEPNEYDSGVSQERERCQGIHAAVRASRLPSAWAEKLIADGVALVDAQRKIFDELAKRDLPKQGPREGGSVLVGDDPLVHVRAGIENALLHRVAPTAFKLEEHGRAYRGLTMLDTARIFLQAQGVRTSGMSKMEIAGMALGLQTRAGFHTTTDFANLLADVTAKTLRRAYEEAPQTFTRIARLVQLPDFKPVKRLQLGDAPQLLKVDEDGEFTRGTIGEGKEQFQLATYGRVFAITRKSLVNDDTDAFSRVPMLFGRAARNLESNLVWLEILSNPTMGDGVALFHATHANLSGTSDAIAVAAIGAGRAAMRKQVGLDAQTLLNLNPKFLIVPPSKETLADQFVSTNLLASQSSAVNPFAGRLEVISEPRLEVGIGSVAGSATAWFLAASPDQVDILEYGYLDGENGPVVESRIGFDVDGLEVKCRHDTAAKVIDHRGLWKNPGA
jgi:hypothetical protein